MNKQILKELLVVGIILLFVGMTMAPTINYSVVKASTDNDLVEVTSQACGIQGFGNTTVKLTKEQYLNLEQYLVDFRARLNQTTTKEEAIPIFKDAVVELNKYGLLPKGMNVEKAQRLVIGFFQNTRLVNYIEKLLDKSSSQDENRLCTIYGKTQSNTVFQGPVSRAIAKFLWKILYNIPSIGFIGIFVYLASVGINTISFVSSLFLRDRPYLGATIFYGSEWWVPGFEPNYYPAQGYIWTNGENGIKNWSGSFYGTLPAYGLSCFLFGPTFSFPGVNGFTGLRLYINQTDIFLGYAIDVDIGPNHP